MLVIVQIWDAQNQEATRRVGATSRRIASKIAEVLHDGNTATIVPRCPVLSVACLDMCSALAQVCFGPIADSSNAANSAFIRSLRRRAAAVATTHLGRTRWRS